MKVRAMTVAAFLVGAPAIAACGPRPVISSSVQPATAPSDQRSASADGIVANRSVDDDASDRLEIARAVCDGSPVRSSGEKARCSCPAYTEFGGDGELEIEEVFAGSFTGTDRDEMVVRTRGCESGAGTSFTFDGIALVRRAPSGVVRLSYDRGPIGDCMLVRSEVLPSKLVCHAFAGHGGLYQYTYSLVGYVAYGSLARIQRQDFLEVSTNVCADRAEAQSELRVLEPTHFSVLGREQYAKGDARALAVEVAFETCVKCANRARACTGAGTTDSIASLRYAFDGTSFAPTSNSRSSLERLRAHEAR